MTGAPDPAAPRAAQNHPSGRNTDEPQPSPMPDPRATADLYGTALRASVEDDSEAGLMRAYDMARHALARDIPLAEIMDIHFAAARSLLIEHEHSQRWQLQTEAFLVEFMSVYDMALRGYKTAVPRLQQEIVDRQRIEAQLRETSAELATQRDSLDQLVAERTRDLMRKTADLDVTLEHLRQTNREQAEFTYAISHDLKSPSNTITMLTDELATSAGGQLDAEGLELVSLIRKTSARMSKLVDDVLAYARCVDHQAPLVRVDPNSIMAEILADLRFDILQSGASITVEDMPEILGDPMQIKLLLQNLISNALKFRPPDRAVRIAVTAKVDRSQVLIGVNDNGVGIAAAHFDRIFELFQRLYTHDDYPGSGIGLALCKRIVGNMGGKISVTSQPGVGSIFTTSLQRFVD